MGARQRVEGVEEAEVVYEAAQVGLSNVRAFMEALTDPAAEDLSALVPAAVPSGLVVGGGR